MKRRKLFAACCMTVIVGILVPGAVLAEVTELRIAGGFGITNLPINVMQKRMLLEKHAKALGLGEITPTYVTLAGGANLNDGLLSGAIDVGFPSPTSLLPLWAKTRDGLDVRAISAVSSMPLYLNISNPTVKTIRDLSDKDRIAVPSLRVSIQPILLQMAAAKIFGDANAGKFDPLVVAMPHPEAATALLTGSAGITGHFGSPPFQYQELGDPKIHKILDSYEILGGPSTFVIAICTGKFYKANPMLIAAFYAALKESIDWINSNKREAAELYLEVTHDKRSSVGDILAMLNDPKIVFTTTPQHTMEYANFMYKIGMIKVKPESWKDLFFPTVYNLPGS